MKLFAEYYNALDSTKSYNDKREITKDYFSKANDKDKLWSLNLFSGRKIRKIVNTTQLKDWASEFSNIPGWLFDESNNSVGDLSETISLILPVNEKDSGKSLSYWINVIEELKAVKIENKKDKITECWKVLGQNEIFIFNNLITGGLKSVVTLKIISDALSQLENTEKNIISIRLMSQWHPQKITYKELIKSRNRNDKISRPYLFNNESTLYIEPEELGNTEDWQAEWKWDGLRCQLILRNGELFLWTQGEEYVTDKFPELGNVKSYLPDGIVFDGEIICYTDGKPLPFNLLKTRIGRKNITPKILIETPVVFMICDILEYEGADVRSITLKERREIINNMKFGISDLGFMKISEELKFSNWNELRKIREKSREKYSEGIILKRKNSAYYSDEKKIDRWKWKAEPFTIDAVMIYAQKGQGRKADMYTDYTFALWDDGKLISVAKANTGLSEAEVKEADEFVKANTLEKFGPVRTVKPELVFEIAFDGIAESNRRKSGVELRFPRILKWRKDKRIEDAGSLENLRKMLK